MFYKGSLQEYLFVADLVPERMYMFDRDLHTGLSIVWNTGEKAHFNIDHESIVLDRDCILFLTGLHRINDFGFETLRVIQFNRPFYCVEEHDSDVGCKGLLFFGAPSIPKITIPVERRQAFNLLWQVLLMEIEERDKLGIEMLRALLKRFLILSLRIYHNQRLIIGRDSKNIGLIREYNYLVEKHFRTSTTVADYARMLFKSPKTLSNLFKKYIDKTPLQIIQDRRLLEAKRLLRYTDGPIQQIADQLSFRDIQAFSHFFKKETGYSPSSYRQQ